MYFSMFYNLFQEFLQDMDVVQELYRQLLKWYTFQESILTCLGHKIKIGQITLTESSLSNFLKGLILFTYKYALH